VELGGEEVEVVEDVEVFLLGGGRGVGAVEPADEGLEGLRVFVGEVVGLVGGGGEGLGEELGAGAEELFVDGPGDGGAADSDGYEGGGEEPGVC